MVSAIEIETWLEWAGKRLLTLSVSKIKPAEPQVAWPTMVQTLNPFERLHHEQREIKIAGPSKDEIPVMDLILDLPNVCHRDVTRRIVRVRTLLNPRTDKHLYTWTKIARLISADPRTVKHYYLDGLEETATKMDPQKVWRLNQFFAEHKKAL